MSETATTPLRSTLLGHFGRKADGRLSAGDLRKKLGLGPGKDASRPEATEADQALAGLIEEGLISTAGGTRGAQHPQPNASYRLTEKGRDQLRPARPDLPDELLGSQESFILLQVFRTSDHKLTRSKLNEKLKTRAATGQLEFNVKAAPATIDYHLAALVEKGCLVEHRRGPSVSYDLEPERGIGALAAARQHDAVNFTMSGAILNQLLEAARQGAPISARQDQPSESGEVSLRQPTPPSRPVGPHDIASYVDQLRAGVYAGKDLVPIHEVRRLVAEHHGAAAAAHSSFDPLLMEMRSGGQLELIAISDSRRATQPQLDDSIPGMNETIFYIALG